jgi:hypothetical protein
MNGESGEWAQYLTDELWQQADPGATADDWA